MRRARESEMEYLRFKTLLSGIGRCMGDNIGMDRREGCCIRE
jgi:hypothetical protein